MEILRTHGITEAGVAIMEKPNKSRQDYYDFLRERENFFVSQLEQYGFKKPLQPSMAEDDEPIDD
jgi:hypothetical protein